MQNANQLFCKLYKILYESNISFKKRKSSATTNSIINNTTYLSMAIYFFIGNNKYNIGLNYSIYTNEVYTLVWKITDLINSYNKLKIKFSNHKE